MWALSLATNRKKMEAAGWIGSRSGMAGSEAGAVSEVRECVSELPAGTVFYIFDFCRLAVRCREGGEPTEKDGSRRRAGKF